MAKIIIDDSCIGCGVCESIYPDVFEMRDDGKAYVKEDVTDWDESLVQEAIDQCPTGSISIVED